MDKNKMIQKRIRRKATKPLPTIEEIDKRLRESGEVWRARTPMERERGKPVNPGEVRAFLHVFQILRKNVRHSVRGYPQTL